MLDKPCDGWCHMHFFDVDMVLSYLGYLCYEGNGPFEWLKACKFGLDNQLPVTLQFETEGKGKVILISDFTRTCMLPTPAIHNEELVIYDDYNVMNLIENLVMDIDRDFDSWISQWIAMSGSHDLSKEDERFITDRKHIPDMEYQAYEQLELQLKKALRETESAWLRMQWKGR